jgi:D-xylose reductase
MSFVVDLMSDSTLVEVFEVRRLLEPAATALAAQRITPERLEVLRISLKEMKGAHGAEELIYRDMEFHGEIAAATGRTPAQVVLRWGVQRGTSVIPKTSRIERLAENLDVESFTLDDAQMRAITGLDRHCRFNDPGVFCERAFGTFFPIYD